MKSLRKQKIVLAFLISAVFFFPNLLSSVVFSIYIGTGHTIDLATAFSVIIFFDLIIDPMINFPLMISSFVDFSVSMARIQDFLSQKEIDVDKLINKEQNNEFSIQIKNQSFSWGVKENEEEEEKIETTEKKVNEEFQEPLIKDDIENSDQKNDVQTLGQLVTLKQIDLKVKQGEFICVIGSVGSGKSSLLNTIIGDMLYVSPKVITKYGSTQGF